MMPLIAGGVAILAALRGLAPPPPFTNPSLPLEVRLDDLMARLTPKDLVGQLGGPGIGTISRPNLTLPGTSYGQECLSGVSNANVNSNHTGTSAFPNPVNLGMSWDKELVEAVGSAIGDEKRSFYNAKAPGSGVLCLSPVLNVARGAP